MVVMLQMSYVVIVVGVLWILAAGVNSRDCSATIFGPLLEGVQNQTFIQNASDAQPAVVHCRVSCEDPGGAYDAAMGIILTEFGTFGDIRAGDREVDGLYTIIRDRSNIQYCTPSNNTMEFRYYFYPWSPKMNKTVLTCGVVYNAQAPCWGQSYLIINYISTAESASSTASLPHTTPPTTTGINPTPTPSLPTKSSPSTSSLASNSQNTVTTLTETVTSPDTTVTVTECGNRGEPSVVSQVQPAAVYAPPSVLGVALVLAILVAIFEGVIIALIRKNRIKPSPDQKKDNNLVLENKSGSNYQ